MGRVLDTLHASVANTGKTHEMTKDRVLAALDKPRSTTAVSTVVNPGGSAEVVQRMLMEMRDDGLVKFDIKKGQWSRA